MRCYLHVFKCIVTLSSKVLLDRAPPSWLEAQRARADIMNVPRVGSHYNEGFFTHVQLNVAAPAKFNAGTTLSSDLATAGGAHGDDNDDPHSLSALTPLGDLGDMHPGHMHIVELGLYRRLEYLSSFFFNGKHIHGATPPQPLSRDFELFRFFTRLMAICYPKLAAMDRFHWGAYSISPWPFITSFFENNLRSLNAAPAPPKNNKLNFVHDGAAAMQRGSLVTFVLRDFLCFVLAVLKEWNRSLPIRVDPSAFLRSFSYRDANGQWVQLDGWQYAPGDSPIVDAERARVDADLQQRTWAISLLIPKVVASKPFEGYVMDPPPVTIIEGVHPTDNKDDDDDDFMVVEDMLLMADDIEMGDDADDVNVDANVDVDRVDVRGGLVNLGGFGQDAMKDKDQDSAGVVDGDEGEAGDGEEEVDDAVDMACSIPEDDEEDEDLELACVTPSIVKQWSSTSTLLSSFAPFI